MTALFKNYIGGEWVESSGGGTFERHNPATGELVGAFTKSGPEAVDRAVAAAKKAFATWRLYPAPKRGEMLFKVARMLEDRKEDLAREMTQEMGKVLNEARGDVQEAIDNPRSFHVSGRMEVERGISATTREGLSALGHDVAEAFLPWGGGQAILIDWKEGGLVGGSDARKDGAAIGY